MVITPTDVDRQWIVHVAPTLTVAPEGAPVDGDVGATIGGAATEIYLTLWNRGDEATVAGRPDILEQWHATQRVRWS